MSYYYTTCNGKPTGRASYYFRSKDNADKRCADQNARASNLGIKARYVIVEHNGAGIDVQSVRD